MGADGCRAGWVIAAGDVDARGRLGTITLAVVPSFAAVLKHRADRIVVDMPIGMPETWSPGGRLCDIEARALLGPGRGSSVFPGPPRPALDLDSWDDPRREGLGMSLQTWLILPRIREVDAAVTPERQDPAGTARPVILEGHPELIFCDLAGGNPVAGSKHAAEGRLRRRVLLEDALGRPIPIVVPQGADEDDVLDAMACLWVAAAPRASLSAVPRGLVPRDGRGLAMRIWRRDAAGDAPGRRPADEGALLDRVLAALGPTLGATVQRRSGAGIRGHGMTLEHDRVRVVVDVDRTAGLERLAAHWASLRESGEERRVLLVHLVRARQGPGGTGRAKDWLFLVGRMEEDLARLGRRRPAGWDAARVEWGGEADATAVASAAALIRAALEP